MVVDRRFNRADGLAGRRLAMHAGDGLEDGLWIGSSRMLIKSILSQCMTRPVRISSGPIEGILFSDWQATMQALQPMQAPVSITMAQA